MMDTKKKPRLGWSAGVCVTTLVVLILGSVYLLPSGNVTGGWVYVKDSPTLAVAPMPVPNKRNVEVTIAGSGFEPGEEIGLRIVMGGVMSDVRHQVKPAPKANEYGAFVSEWKLGNELKLLKPGAYSLMAVNENGDVLAHAPFVVDEPPAKDAKKKK
jgi:hypothetical protein